MKAAQQFKPTEARTLLSFLDDPVAVISAKGRMVFINPAFQRRLHLPPMPPPGAKMETVLPGWLHEPLKDQIPRMSPDTPSRNFTVRSQRERFLVKLAPIELNGRLAGVMVSLSEVFDEDRENSIELFRTMIEDLRGPLGELNECATGPSGKAGARKLETNIDTIREGIARFREFGELFFGKPRMEQVAFHPNRLLTLVYKSLRSLAVQHEVHLEDTAGRELPRLVGEPAILNRVLALLVDFMIRSAPKGEIVAISAEMLLMPDGSPELAYSITGTGFMLPAGKLDAGELFSYDYYQKLPDARKKLWLRLLLAQKLIKAVGGEFTGAAHETAGSTLCIRVPAAIHFSAT